MEIVMSCLAFWCDIFGFGRGWPVSHSKITEYHRSSSWRVDRQDESLHWAEKTQMAQELIQRHGRLNSLDDRIYVTRWMIGICRRIETDEHPIIHVLRWTSCMTLPMGCFCMYPASSMFDTAVFECFWHDTCNNCDKLYVASAEQHAWKIVFSHVDPGLGRATPTHPRSCLGGQTQQGLPHTTYGWRTWTPIYCMS